MAQVIPNVVQCAPGNVVESFFPFFLISADDTHTVSLK